MKKEKENFKMNKEKPSILITDDEPPIIEVFEMVFEDPLKDRCSLIYGRYGQEAIELYQKHSPFLIFIDKTMSLPKDMPRELKDKTPWINGLEASLEIKKQAKSKRKNVVIALMTGEYDSLQDKFDNGELSQIDYLIPKPFKIYDLLDLAKKEYEKYSNNQ